MTWELPGPDARPREHATAARQRASVLAVLMDHDPTVMVSARETRCELIALAAVCEALAGLAETIPEFGAALRNGKEV
ncbi:hypothetical protein [Actinocrispum sp. NPDC049592]|uniref:hypothetical protein n=1 Tax=Actinocrispum sp. NPDC049592 TaxID=3154835 RepID=UPI0034407173